MLSELRHFRMGLFRLFLHPPVDDLNTNIQQVETILSPENLLKTLKDIESLLGRSKSIKNGLRSIDLDILLYHNLVYETPHLTIAHPKLLEREFVLRPLCKCLPSFPPPPPHPSNLLT